MNNLNDTGEIFECLNENSSCSRLNSNGFNGVGQGIGGHYIVKVIKKNGDNFYPFGKSPRKNMILDQFFQNYIGTNPGTGFTCEYGIESIIQCCQVGISDQAPDKTDTGLIAPLDPIVKTWASSSFNRDATAASDTAWVGRDFIFDTNNTGSAYPVREAIVGYFGDDASSFFPVKTVFSRFVFPSDVVVENGDRLVIFYQVTFVLPWLNREIAISLSGSGLDFSGTIGYSGHVNGIFGIGTTSNNSGSTNTRMDAFQNSSWNGTSRNAQNVPSDVRFRERNFTINSSNFGSSVLYSVIGNSSITSYPSFIFVESSSNQVAFYQNYTPPAFGSITGTYTRQGPAGLSSRNAFSITDSGCYTDFLYTCASHTSNRSNITGVFLRNLRPSTSTSTSNTESSLFLQFNTPQTIPIGMPINFKLRFYFNRL